VLLAELVGGTVLEFCPSAETVTALDDGRLVTSATVELLFNIVCSTDLLNSAFARRVARSLSHVSASQVLTQM